MRFATFVFCFYFIFATTTAHAIAFAPLVMGAGGGMLAKTAGKKALVLAKKSIIPSALYWCAHNKKCKDLIGDALEHLLNNDGREHPFSECKAAIYENGKYIPVETYLDSPKSFVFGETEYRGFITEESKRDAMAMVKKRLKELMPTSGAGYHQWRDQDVLRLDFKGKQVGGNQSYNSDLNETYYIKCNTIIINNDNRQEVVNRLINNISDDDINQIINNYYTDNRVEFEQNIAKYCQTGACHEVSEELEQQIRDGEQDIDKVNKQNCRANEKGVLVSCEKDFELTPPPEKKPKNCKPHKKTAKVNPDQLPLDFGDDKEKDDSHCEPEGDKNDKDKPDDKGKGKDKEPPIDCNSNKMYRQLCEFMDWADDEADEPNQEKVNVKDKATDKADKDKIDVHHSCPPPENIAISVVGYTTTIVFDYKPYCDFAFKVRPYMVSAGGLMAMYILSGRRT